MGWTAREDLVVLYASGHVDIYNIRGDLLPTSFQLIVDAARMGKDTVLRMARGRGRQHSPHCALTRRLVFALLVVPGDYGSHWRVGTGMHSRG